MFLSARSSATSSPSTPLSTSTAPRPTSVFVTPTYSTPSTLDPLQRGHVDALPAREALRGLRRRAVGVERGAHPRAADEPLRVGLARRDVLDERHDPARCRVHLDRRRARAGSRASLSTSASRTAPGGPADLAGRQLLGADLEQQRRGLGDRRERRRHRGGLGRRGHAERVAELLAALRPQLPRPHGRAPRIRANARARSVVEIAPRESSTLNVCEHLSTCTCAGTGSRASSMRRASAA